MSQDDCIRRGANVNGGVVEWCTRAFNSASREHCHTHTLWAIFVGECGAPATDFGQQPMLFYLS